MGKKLKIPSADITPLTRKEKHFRWYIVIALCIAFFVVVNMVIIFALSAESREESGTRSADITAFAVRVIYPDYENMSYDDQLTVIESAHPYVRKAAHFLEYALLGLLTSGFLLFIRRFLSRHMLERWKTWLYPTVFCFLYAVTDEVHQIFSNRGASPKDVLIDTLGAIFGVLFIQWIVSTAGRPRRRKKDGRRIGKGRTKFPCKPDRMNNTDDSDTPHVSEQEEPPCVPPDTV